MTAGSGFPSDSQFEFELQRTMGQVAYGAAEIGECLAAAQKVQAGDVDGWHTAWHDLATWVRQQAESAEARGHRVSAREGYLRAANYFRTSDFFLHADPTDPRISVASAAAVRSFVDATRLMDAHVEPIEIPYGDTTLPGYFYRADGAAPGEVRPTVVIHNGFDGSGEEIWSLGGRAVQERGMHVIAFEGPGQGRVIREQGLPFRTDWEAVVTPVVDHALTRPDVDPERIALVGISLGGVLAPRAAAHEPRLAAVVAWDGVYDAGCVPPDVVFAGSGIEPDELWRRLDADQDHELDAYIEKLTDVDDTIAWIVDHGTWVMGVEHARALFHRYGDFHVKDGVAERIACPVLVLEASDDFAFAGQPEMLASHLTAPHDLVTFDTERGGSLHNQVDVLRRAGGVIADWIAETLR